MAIAETYEEICTFCREVTGDTPQNLFYDLGIATTGDGYSLYESDHHVVFPCIGALTDWYVPIVSRQHTLSAGWLPPDHPDDLRHVINHIRSQLTAFCGVA